MWGNVREPLLSMSTKGGETRSELQGSGVGEESREAVLLTCQSRRLAFLRKETSYTFSRAIHDSIKVVRTTAFKKA